MASRLQTANIYTAAKIMRPGPGRYEYKTFTDPNSNIRFEQNPKNTCVNRPTSQVGPGKYQPSFVDKKTNPGWCFGSSQRSDMTKVPAAMNLGPGTYGSRDRVGELPSYARPPGSQIHSTSFSITEVSPTKSPGKTTTTSPKKD